MSRGPTTSHLLKKVPVPPYPRRIAALKAMPAADHRTACVVPNLSRVLAKVRVTAMTYRGREFGAPYDAGRASAVARRGASAHVVMVVAPPDKNGAHTLPRKGEMPFQTQGNTDR